MLKKRLLSVFLVIVMLAAYVPTLRFETAVAATNNLSEYGYSASQTQSGSSAHGAYTATAAESQYMRTSAVQFRFIDSDAYFTGLRFKYTSGGQTKTASYSKHKALHGFIARTVNENGNKLAGGSVYSYATCTQASYYAAGGVENYFGDNKYGRAKTSAYIYTYDGWTYPGTTYDDSGTTRDTVWTLKAFYYGNKFAVEHGYDITKLADSNENYWKYLTGNSLSSDGMDGSQLRNYGTNRANGTLTDIDVFSDISFAISLVVRNLVTADMTNIQMQSGDRIVRGGLASNGSINPSMGANLTILTGAQASGLLNMAADIARMCVADADGLGASITKDGTVRGIFEDVASSTMPVVPAVAAIIGNDVYAQRFMGVKEGQTGYNFQRLMVFMPSYSTPITEGSLTIRKVDKTTGSPLAGAKFYLEKSDGSILYIDDKAYYETDSSGTVVISKIPFGTYTLWESNTPKNYRTTAADAAACTPAATRTGGRLNWTITIDENHQDVSITAVNSKTPAQISVYKTWLDNNDELALRPTELTFTLYKDGVEYMTRTIALSSMPGGMTLFASNLDPDAEYDLVETVPSMYTSTKVKRQNGPLISFEFYNSTVDTVSLDLTKTWDDSSNAYNNRPSSVTFNIYRTYPGLSGREFVRSVQITGGADDTWTASSGPLEKYMPGTTTEYEYSVEEASIPAGYTAAVTSNTSITNTLTEIEYTVNKLWDDEDNLDGIRPSSVTAQIKCNGDVIRTVTVPASGSITVTGLPAYINGEPAVYTVDEENPPVGYTLSGVTYGTNSATLTNEHKVVRTEVFVTKIWEDDDNACGIRPTSVTVNLLRNNVVIDSKPLNESNGWYCEFTNLQASYQGVDYVYTVQEVVPAGYTASYEDGEGGIFITNTHTPEKVTVRVNKTWSDGNNQDNSRPDTITLNLLRDNVIIDTQTIAASADSFYYEWPNLPKYHDNHTEYVYTVTEEPINGYTPEITPNATNAYTIDIINTHETEKVNITLNKTWNDGNNQDGLRPASITIQIYKKTASMAAAEPFQTATLTAAGGWTTTISGLAANDGGEPIVYSFGEPSVSGYTSSISSTTSVVGGVLTYNVQAVNNHTPEKVSVTVNKTWSDNNNQDGMRPATVVINLLRDSVVIDSHTVTSANADNWSYQFTNLDKYHDGGTPYVYTVTENAIPGYTPEIVAGTSPYTYNITNSHTSEKVGFTFTKTWSDGNNQDGIRPGSITFDMYKQTSAMAAPQYVRTITLTAAGGWADSIDEMDAYEGGLPITYTFSEASVSGYTGTVSTVSSVVSGKTVYAVTLSNSHTPQAVSINISKTWNDGNNQDGLRPTSITIQIYKKTANMSAAQPLQVATLTASGGWTTTISGLPAYEGGEPIVYSFGEPSVSGYTSSISSTTSVVAGVQTYTVQAVNNHTPEKVAVTVNKTWSDNNNQDGMRPATVVVNLLRDNVVVDSHTVTSANVDSWSYQWTNLDKYHDGGTPYVYTVTEDAIPGYAPEITAGTTAYIYNIVNSHTSEKVGFEFSKIWNDGNNQDGLRPTSITFDMYKQTSAMAAPQFVRTITLTAANNWQDSIAEMDAYEGGLAIAYTFTEASVNGYTGSVSTTSSVVGGKTVYNVTLSNSHTPEVTSVTINKSWSDANNQDGIRPSTITVQLLRDDVVYNTVVIENATRDTFSYTWPNLPKYHDGGTPYSYTVRESDVSGYTHSIDPVAAPAAGTIAFDIVNSHTPETVKFKFTKQWSDANNQDGVRPASVTIAIYKSVNGGAATFIQNVVLTAAENWYKEVDNLPKFEGGLEIVYSYVEANIDNYTLSSISSAPSVVGGQTVYTVTATNAHTPEKISLSGNKVWNDEGNVEGIRPASVTIILYRDNVRFDSVACTGAFEFNNLDRYHDGGIEYIYSIGEETVEGYTPRIEETSPGVFTVTNTHVPERVSLSADKVWRDANNQDGKRTASVTANLYRDDVLVDSAVMNAGNNWHVEFNNLLKSYNGHEYSYEIRESVVPTGYAVSYATENGVTTITNSYTPEVINISGVKTWNDGNNQDGVRPRTVTIQLYQDGVPYDSTVLTGPFTDATGYIFNNLPKYHDGGVEYVYTVAELNVDANYSATVTGFNIENAHTPETIDIEGTKTWSDNNNQDGVRPNTVTIQLYQDGIPYDTVELTGPFNASTTYKFEGLPKYHDGGVEYVYTVGEINVDSHYTATVDGYNINNAHTPETTSIEVNKVWADNNNQDGKRPTSVSVALRANGTTISRGTLNAGNNWHASWSNLPKYYNGGAAFIYEVVEESVPGGYDMTSSSENGVFTITNTYTPETITISGVKTWNDANNQDGKRPSSITIQLYQDDVPYQTRVLVGPFNNSTSYSFENLPKYHNAGTAYVYTVAELDVDGNYVATVTGYNIENAHTPETVNIDVTKTWTDDNDRDGLRSNEIFVSILRDGQPFDTLVLNADNNWHNSLDGLQKYHDGGTEYTYSVEELSINPYVSSVNVRKADNVYTVSIENIYTPQTTNITVTKTWNDDDDRDRVRPESISVNFKIDGVIDRVLTLNAANDWSVTINNLPVYRDHGVRIEYSVEEVVPNGYQAQYDASGFVITNSHTPEKVAVSVLKLWSDENNRDGKRPATITFNLLANDVIIDSQTLNTAEVSSYVWSNLNKYENGVEIVYTVTEDAVAGYDSRISEIAEHSFMVVNAYTPERVKVTATKTWSDDNDRDGIRPETLEFTLYANGVIVGTKTLNINDGETFCEWTDLYKYENGTIINYVVTENTPNGYSSSSVPQTDAQGNVTVAFTNTHTPERIELDVLKTWDDDDNRDGFRPVKVTVHLYANGAMIDTVDITSSTDNGNVAWYYKWTNLYKYEGGSEIQYSITEDDVLHYEGEVGAGTETTWKILNTHTPEVVEIGLVKTWNDDGNRDGVRPTKVKFNLLANDTVIDSVELDVAERMTYTWRNLYKYEDGEAINYTVEEVVPAGYTSRSSSADGVWTFVNSHTPEKVSVRVTKIWDDDDNRDRIRPATLTFKLLANGVKVGEEEVEVVDGMVCVWSNLNKYENGELINYTVVEDQVEGYTTVMTETETYVWTAKNTHEPAKVDVKIIKTWNDDSNRDALRPATITVRLYANGTEIDHVDCPINTESDTAFEYTWNDLNKFEDGVAIEYTVSEDEVLNYTGEFGDDIDDLGNVTWNIVNTHDIATVEVEAIKTWNDDSDRDGLRPLFVTVHLYADGVEIDNSKIEVSDDETIAWRYKKTGLPRYNKGAEIVYTIEEDEVLSYTSEITTDKDDDGNITWKIINTHEIELTEVSALKTWNDDDNRDGLRPLFVTVHLFANDVEIETAKIEISDDSNIAWRYSKNNLSKNENGQPIVYTITEDEILGYTSEIKAGEGTTWEIVNTHVSETVRVSGEKHWIDDNNKAGLRPLSVTVRLYADDVEIDSVTVTEADGWKFAFDNLYKYNNGVEIKYTVSEDDVEHYVGSVEGYEIYNDVIPQTGDTGNVVASTIMVALALVTGVVCVVRRRKED